jgi:hypothetical protein
MYLFNKIKPLLTTAQLMEKKAANAKSLKKAIAPAP